MKDSAQHGAKRRSTQSLAQSPPTLTLEVQRQWKSTRFQRANQRAKAKKENHHRKAKAKTRANRKTPKAKANHSRVAKVMAHPPKELARHRQSRLMSTVATNAVHLVIGRKIAESFRLTKLLVLLGRLKVTTIHSVLHQAPAALVQLNSLQVRLLTGPQQAMSIVLLSVIQP